MKEYDVTITETLEMTVAVEAESREEASFLAVKDSPQGNGMCMYQQASPFGDKRQLVRGNTP